MMMLGQHNRTVLSPCPHMMCGQGEAGEHMKQRIKCYIYTRVSTSMQVEGYSLDGQKDRLRKYADYQDYQIVGEYCDEGKIG